MTTSFRTTNTARRTASGSPAGTGTSTYGRHMSAVLTAAFALSAGHTVYAWVEGIEDPSFTVTTPLTWVFYAVAFGSAVLARRTSRAAQLTVLGYLAALLAISIFYYPTTFGPAQQTVFGWFENDVYIGLLVTATYLGVQRLRRTTLTPA
ncbi:hypothetical protein N865_12355 [Intrasporangium oryzae NRRL B-24470]|uniref:Uncharacterized protein n=1 Tax=Intrasporangium oryzae NRRL B-24470 TaxID=1386089 RepID=W9G888_9MICO|nr:hypothetical protein [Intrasporangium oryzae]EWT00064.1 hypothetical protein N865_12355 [Intrasporangium oryzae NRRL B-24470]